MIQEKRSVNGEEEMRRADNLPSKIDVYYIGGGTNHFGGGSINQSTNKTGHTREYWLVHLGLAILGTLVIELLLKLFLK